MIKEDIKNLHQNKLKNLKNISKSNFNSKHFSKTKRYNCSRCKDLKFIINDNEAKPCVCRDTYLINENIKKSNISENFLKKTFENFNYSYDVVVMTNYKICIDYYRNFSKNKESIFICGQVGSGKTHLSLAISNKLMNDNKYVLYMNYRECILSLKQNILDESRYNNLMNKYKRAEVLLIDDLFKGNITKSDINIMFEIINYRYFNNLPLIISCEMDFSEMLKIDEAIGSRLFEMCKNYYVKFEGKNLNYRIYGGM